MCALELEPRDRHSRVMDDALLGADLEDIEATAVMEEPNDGADEAKDDARAEADPAAESQPADVDGAVARCAQVRS